MTTKSESRSPCTRRLAIWRMTLRFVAVFAGVILLSVLDFFWTRKVSGGGENPDIGMLGALIGFAVLVSLVLGTAWNFSMAIFGFEDQRRVRGKVAIYLFRFIATAPFLYPLYLLTMSLFKGGKVREFLWGGVGPVLAFLCLYAALNLVIDQWRRHLAARNALAGLVLLVLGVVSHYCDRTYYVGLYDVIHEALGLCAILFGSMFIDRILKVFPSPRLVGLWALIGASIFCGGGYYHFTSFFDGPAGARVFLFQDLTTSRSLIRRIPYRRELEVVRKPVELSERFQRWNTEREVARLRMAELRGDKPLNLLILSIDAVRRDHTTLHGYKRNTTPFLAELSKQCVVFDDVRSPSTSSFFSLMSAMSGSYPSSISLRRGRDPDLLGQSLADSGYESLGIYTDAIFVARPVGWPKPDIRLGMNRHEYATVESKTLVPRLLDAMSQFEQKFFVLTHIMDPHFPYNSRPGFDFGSQEIDKYDSEIAFTDSQLRILFDGMKEKGLLENTVVVITADHGEAFGEHGAYLHGGSPFEEQCRVPLMLYLPFMREGKRIPGTVGLTSLAPTLVDIFGSRDLKNHEAPSLLPLIFGQSDPAEYYAVVERPSILDRRHFPPVSAIVHGNYKYRVQYDADLKLLFDIENDPLEHRELSAKNPELYRRMTKLYREWQGDCLIHRNEMRVANSKFATLRNEILLGRKDLIDELFVFINSDDVDVRKEAAYLLFDLEVSGRLEHESGLCSKKVHSTAPDIIAIRDILKAKVQRRPFLEGMDLVASQKADDRKRAALVLWHLAELPFASEIAADHVIKEEDQFVKAELYGVLARAEKEIDISMVFDLAVEVGGDVGARMIFGMMGRDEPELDEKIRSILFHENSPLSHTIIENLGAIDNEFRRDLLVRLLRQNRMNLRTSAIGGVGNFPKSEWHEDLLCQLVKHERHRGLRIECANHLNAYKSDKASKAILDAFSAFPDSALGIGYILSNFRRHALDNWEAKEVDVTTEYFIGKDTEIEFDVVSQDKQYARRLFITLVRQSKTENTDDTIKVLDADGQVLLTQGCKIAVEFFHVDLNLIKKPIKMPLAIRIESPSREKGERLGIVLAFLVPKITMASLWPSDAPHMKSVSILQRFSKGWDTSMEDINSCFLTASSGTLFLEGAKAERQSVTIELTTPALACDLEVSLRDTVITTVRLEGGNVKRRLELNEIKRLYRQNGTNRLTFRVFNRAPGVPPNGQVRDLALHSVVFK